MQAGFSKSVINTSKRVTEQLSEEEKEKRMKKFVKENEKLIKVQLVIIIFYYLLHTYACSFTYLI